MISQLSGHGRALGILVTMDTVAIPRIGEAFREGCSVPTEQFDLCVLTKIFCLSTLPNSLTVARKKQA